MRTDRAASVRGTSGRTAGALAARHGALLRRLTWPRAAALVGARHLERTRIRAAAGGLARAAPAVLRRDRGGSAGAGPTVTSGPVSTVVAWTTNASTSHVLDQNASDPAGTHSPAGRRGRAARGGDACRIGRMRDVVETIQAEQDQRPSELAGAGRQGGRAPGRRRRAVTRLLPAYTPPRALPARRADRRPDATFLQVHLAGSAARQTGASQHPGELFPGVTPARRAARTARGQGGPRGEVVATRSRNGSGCGQGAQDRGRRECTG